MNVAILLYDGVTALDAIGPYEVLACMPDAEGSPPGQGDYRSRRVIRD